MAIKDTALNAYFGTRAKEEELAQQLDEAFDVTFGSDHGGLSFWLVDPKPFVRERFGLNKEILVIHCPHSTVDARCLTAIENISRSPDFRHRIDKALFLLLHNVDTEQVSNLIQSDPDKVIVPLAESELSNPKRGSLFIRARIAERFGEIDLFGMSSPITSDLYFFGRETLVQELVIRSTTKYQNTGLFGLRKTGKTSVLRAVERRMTAQRILTEYIDCHNPGIHANRWWHVLENIIERLAGKLRTEFRRTARISHDYSQTNAGTRFSMDIQTILREGHIEKVVLLLDEVEFITPNLSGALGKHWDIDFVPFWQTIRATHQETSGRLVFMVAGVNPAAVEETRFNNISNPIFQLAPPYFLETFDKPRVREMVRTLGKYAGVVFEESCFGYLTDTFGGHPYLIRIACSQVWRSVNNKDPQQRVQITADDFAAQNEKIKERLAQPIKDILLSLVWWYPEEYQLLQMLAGGEQEFVREYVGASPSSMLRFAQYGLLKPNQSTFTIEYLKEFLKVNGESYKNELSPFTRSDIPPEYLPEVPDLATLGALVEKRIEVETKMRKIIIFYLGVHRNWNNKLISDDILNGLKKRPDRKDPASLFVGNTPQAVMVDLYLIDLKEIVLSNWNIFGGLFDNNRPRFEMNMDTLNRIRKAEAHTRVPSKTEISDYENSCAWILRHINAVPNI